MFLLGHALLLRDVIAGNYLAIARHVHALSEEPARFNCALQAIGDGMVWFIQGFDDLTQVSQRLVRTGTEK